MGKILVFDVDGVIIDVSKTYHLAIQKTVERYVGESVPLEEVKNYKFRWGINNDYYASYAIIALKKYGVPEEEIKKLSLECKNAVAFCLEKRFNLPITVDEVTQTFIDYFEGVKDNEELFLEPFVFEWLKRKKYKLAVLTGRPKGDLEYSFKKFNLLDKFDVIVCDDTIEDVALRKPNPYALYYTLKLLGAKPKDDKYYLGDTVADKWMAQGYKNRYGDTNLTYIQCNFSEKREEGDITFYTPKELKNFLLQL